MFESKIAPTAPIGIGYGRPAMKAQVPYVAQGGGSAAMSRNAFAAAAAQRQSTAANKEMENYRNEYAEKAQQARSADLQSQQAQAVRYGGLGLEKQTTQRQIAMQQAQKTADINLQRTEAEKDAKSRSAQAAFNLLVGSGLLTGPLGTQGLSYGLGAGARQFTNRGGVLAGLTR